MVTVISPQKILVLCTGNSCRSQILEAWLRHFSEGKFEVYSAGVETHGINPDAVFYMNEIGIDLSSHTSDLMDKYLHMEFDLIGECVFASGFPMPA